MTLDWEGGTLEESGKLDNPDYRCEHGTFIGDPYGPDYMCHWCEMGISVEEMDKQLEAEAKWRRRKQYHLDKAKEHSNFIPVSDTKIARQYHYRLALWHLRRYVDISGERGRGTIIGRTRRRYRVFKLAAWRWFHPIESAIQAALRERPRVGR